MCVRLAWGPPKLCWLDRFVSGPRESGHYPVNADRKVIPMEADSIFRFVVQLDRAQPSEGWNRGSNPRESTKVTRWWQMGMHLIVYQTYAGPNPVRRARL